MKLQSMTDFVLGAWRSTSEIQSSAEHNTEQLRHIINYAKLLRTPLTLGMFVPCDEEGNVLEEPKFPTGERRAYDGLAELYDFQLRDYNEAKERILFEGFTIEESMYEGIYTLFLNDTYFDTWDLIQNMFVKRRDYTVEDLVCSNLTLTKSAIKKLGL